MTGKEYILLSLALASDFLESFPKRRDAYRLSYHSSFPVKSSTYFMSLGRLLADKQIEKVVKDGKNCYRITSVGWKGIEEVIPIERLRLKWDGKLRLVIFDVQEKWKKDRERLRYLLKNLGFGMLQESVWITPFAIEKGLVPMLARERIAGEVLVLRSELLSGKIKDIIARAFDLEPLENAYTELIDQWELGEIKAISDVRKWEQNYFDLLSNDPCLPDALLSSTWAGTQAKNVYMKYIRRLINNMSHPS
ncbi:MAG: CRISPR-associated endonuclease Cas2 [Patescibacteria group bacterium]